MSSDVDAVPSEQLTACVSKTKLVAADLRRLFS
jgi:hypothetical protein